MCIYVFLNVMVPFTECEVLFGIPFLNSSELELINFLLILTKWYINNTKINNRPLYFIELVSIIKDKIMLIYRINNINSRANTDWQKQVYDLFN